MLEIDLLQGGGGWGRDRKSPAVVSGVGARRLARDGWMIGSSLMIIASITLSAYFAVSTRGRAAGREEALATALADSAHSAALIEKMRMLEASRDSIAARAAIIREIDARRYLWPRVMDEVAGVLPAEAWLTRLAQLAPLEDPARFEVEGMTRDNFSLTRFWNAMESSPFIRNVRLISTENVSAEAAGGEAGDLYYFVLQAETENPPPEMLDFVRVRPGSSR